jgi:hypothetical protein
MKFLNTGISRTIHDTEILRLATFSILPMPDYKTKISLTCWKTWLDVTTSSFLFDPTESSKMGKGNIKHL